MKVVLYQPQIPQNTGNIVRTCAVTKSDLLLVRPLGFSTSERQLKRAGLDYWEGVNVTFTDDLLHYLSELQDRRFYFFSSRAAKIYTEIAFTPTDHLIFGSETQGISQEFWEKWPEHFYRIPMCPGARCLNLSNSVSVVLYKGLEQNRFAFL